MYILKLPISAYHRIKFKLHSLIVTNHLHLILLIGINAVFPEKLTKSWVEKTFFANVMESEK